MATDQLQILNRAILADDGRKSNRSLDTRLLGERRIDRRNLTDQIGRLNVTANANSLWRLRFLWFLLRRRRGRRSSRWNAAHDAADYPACRTAGNSAGNSTNHAAHGSRWRFIFGDHRDLFRDLLRSLQFRAVELTDNLLNNFGDRKR